MQKFLFLLISLVAPSVALAHTKWFAEHDLAPLLVAEPTGVYLGAWALVIMSVVIIGVVFEHHGWLQLSSLQLHQSHVFERAASTFVMMVGTFFIIAGTHEYLFSPNLTIESGIPMWLISLQVLLGFTFLLGIDSRLGGVLLALLWGLAFFHTDWISVVENFWVLSTAVFVILMGNDYFAIVSFDRLRSLVAPYKKYAASILRIGTGITLMILGLSEKILAPEYGTNFLHQHDWNFMQQLGLNYSDYLFTISAGAVEFLFGLIFVLGILTRFNALVVAVVFTIPLFILGPMELAGHLPHFAAIILLLLFGCGKHFTILPSKNYHPNQHTS